MNTRSTSTASVTVADISTLIFLAAVWGASFLFFRIAAPEVGPAWAAEARVAIAAVALALVAGRATFATARGRIHQFLIVGTLFSALPFTLLAFASLTLPASFSSLLAATTPLFTAIVAAVWLGLRLSRETVVGLGVGFFAVIVLVGWAPLKLGPEMLVATVATLGMPLSYAFAGTYVRRSMSDVPPIQLATGQLVAAAVVVLPVALLSGPPAMPTTGGIAALALLGLVSTAVAWPLYYRLLARTAPTAASTVTFVVPLFGILWGGLILGERLGPQLFAGFGLIALSLALVLRLRPGLPSFGPMLERLAARWAAATA